MQKLILIHIPVGLLFWGFFLSRGLSQDLPFLKRPENCACVYVAKAVNESSADSGRDTLGTTSGELVTCSNPNSSVASSLDSNSNVQPPTPSGANQPLGDGVGSRVRSSTPAFSSPSPKPAELCQLQPHKSTRLPQHHTPVRQLFTAAKNLQRYTGGILCEHALIYIILYAEMDIIFFGYHFFCI